MNAEIQEIVTPIIKKKHIAGQWPLQRLFAILDGLTEHENAIERKQTKTKNLIKLAVLFLLLSVPGMIAAENYNMSWITPVFGAVAGGSVLALILFGVLLARRQSKDLHDEYRTYLQPLLMYLQDDIKPGSPIAIDFHLSPIEQNQFSKGKGPKYKKGAYHSCRDHTYQRTLLQLKLRLCDGNRLILAINELFIKTSKTKRSASGKYKTKYKIKKRQLTDIRVLLNPEKFSCETLPVEGEPRFYSKEQGHVQIIGLRAKQGVKSLNMERIPHEHADTLKHLVNLYAYIKPQTAVSNPGSNASV